VLAWNGRAWRRIAFPRVGTASQLKDVSVTGHAVWAVGSYESRGGVVRTLAARLRLGDRRWAVFTGRRGSLQGVAASSPDEVWAVGPGKDAKPQRAFVMRWDGTRWTTVRRMGWGTTLQDVVVASPTDAWTVGYRGGMYEHPHPLLLRRHGSPWRWARPPATNGRFFAVDGTPHDLWALSWHVHDTGGGPPLLATFHRC
jgi:hypothetical protein